jgi:Zn-dependent protease
MMAGDNLWPLLQKLLIWIGFFWGVINLLPILPLDGGQALRDFLALFMLRHKAIAYSALSGTLVAAAAAVWFYKNDYTIAPLFMGYFAWQNYKVYQQQR